MKKKAIAYAGAALGAAALTSYLVGKEPRRRPASSQLNLAAPVQSQLSIRINAPAQRVWQVLSRIDQWSSWQPEVSASRLNGPLEAGTTFDWKTSGLRIQSTLHTVAPGMALGWSGSALGSFAVHHWYLVAHEGYTEVRTEETMEGWLVSLLKPAFQRSLEAGNARWLARLKEVAELDEASAGE